MTKSEKNRRSARIAAKHNLMLMLDADKDKQSSKEIVTTLHISKHGAHLLGRRQLLENVTGRLAHLSTCKQAPFRIAWQAPSRAQPGFHEMGIEFEQLADFWGATFEADAAIKAEDAPSVTSTPEEPETSPREKSSSTREAGDCGTILDLLRTISPGAEGRETTDALWCGLIEQLEERRVISRSELIASLRKVGLQL